MKVADSKKGKQKELIHLEIKLLLYSTLFSEHCPSANTLTWVCQSPLCTHWWNLTTDINLDGQKAPSPLNETVSPQVGIWHKWFSPKLFWTIVESSGRENTSLLVWLKGTKNWELKSWSAFRCDVYCSYLILLDPVHWLSRYPWPFIFCVVLLGSSRKIVGYEPHSGSHTGMILFLSEGRLWGILCHHCRTEGMECHLLNRSGLMWYLLPFPHVT